MWVKRWSVVNELESHHFLWFAVDERIQGLGNWNAGVALPYETYSSTRKVSGRHALSLIL